MPRAFKTAALIMIITFSINWKPALNWWGQKSEAVRLGERCKQFAQSFARIRNGQAYLYGVHIEEYEEANQSTP